MSFLLHFIVGLLLLACANKRESGLVSQPPPSGKLVDSTTQVDPVPQTTVVKVDVNQVKVSQIRVGLVSVEEGSTLLNRVVSRVSYYLDGRAESVGWMACPLTPNSDCQNPPCRPDLPGCQGKSCVGNCVQGSTDGEAFYLSRVFQGEVLFEVRACLAKERSLSGVLCGPTESLRYKSPLYDPQLDSVLADIDRIRNVIDELYFTEMENVLSNYSKELKECNEQAASYLKYRNGMLRFIDQYLHQPFRQVKEISRNFTSIVIGEGNTQAAIKELTEFNKSFQKAFFDSCVIIANNKDKVCNTIAQGGASYLAAMNPVDNIAKAANTVSTVIQGFKNKDALVIKKCFAEQHLASKMDSLTQLISFQLTNLETKMADLNGMLTATGEDLNEVGSKSTAN